MKQRDNFDKKARNTSYIMNKYYQKSFLYFSSNLYFIFIMK